MPLTLEEKLFCYTWTDLKRRLESDLGYDLIMASALIRKLLIDGSPLCHLANRRAKLPLVFKCHSTPLEKPQHAREIVLRGFIDSESGKISDFLSTEIIAFEPHRYTVTDVVKACANTYGGVHMSSDRDERDRHIASLRFQDHGILFGNGVAETPMLWGVQQVGIATLNSLSELQSCLTKYAPRKRPVLNFIHKIFTGVPLRNRPNVK